jgi:ABC-type multidrug transport system fused ATPase/permease subunit
LKAAQVVNVAWLAVLGIALVHAVSKLCVWLRLRLLAVLGELVARDLRDQLFSHLQQLSMSFYSRKKTGSLITRISSDTDRLWEFLAFGVVEVTLSLVTLLGLSSVLIYLDWRLGLGRHLDESEAAGITGHAIGDHRGRLDRAALAEVLAQALGRGGIGQTADEQLGRHGAPPSGPDGSERSRIHPHPEHAP